MTPPKRPKPPPGLAKAGKAQWNAIVRDLADGYEFDQRELHVLAAACRQADTVADLEAAIKRDGLMIAGAAGQVRLNAAVTELRQGKGRPGPPAGRDRNTC